MSFNKKYITKDKIILNIKDLNYLYSITRADALFMDKWSTNFYDNFDLNCKDYQEKRNYILDETKFYSFHNYSEFKEYNNLKSLSNIFINLKNNPSWLDIHLCSDIIKIDFSKDSYMIDGNIISGNFKEIVKCCIKAIEKQYSKNG